jgi:hypothetical protein
MRIVAGTVSYEGYGDPSANPTLLGLCSAVLEEARQREAERVCLPGGYLRANGEGDRDVLANAVVAEAKKHGMAVALGIDIAEKKIQMGRKEYIRGYRLPWFAICWSPAERVLHCWRERSANSRDWRIGRRETYEEPRQLRLASGNVEILMCGEIFNPYIRSNTAGARRGPSCRGRSGPQIKGLQGLSGDEEACAAGAGRPLLGAHQTPTGTEIPI